MAFDKEEPTKYLSGLNDRLDARPHIVIVKEADGMRVSLNGDNADIGMMLLVAARDDEKLFQIMRTIVIGMTNEETGRCKH